MKRAIRIAALLLVQLLLITGITVASGGDENTATGTSELMEISVVNWDMQYSFPEGDVEDPMREFFEEKFSITIKAFSVGWGDYNEKMNIWAASGELPDVMGAVDTVGNGRYYQWIDDGVVRALPDDLSPYPNVAKYVSMPDVAGASVDGKTYLLPRLTYEDPTWWTMDRGLSVRKDWMDKLGIDDPQSPDEFIDMCVAFATQDPDGNGKDDTMGLTIAQVGFLWNSFNGFGYVDQNWIKMPDGTYHLGNTTRDALELFKFVRRLYQEGGLDLDFATTNGDDAIANLASGRAGVLMRQVSPKHFNTTKEQWDKLQPDKKFTDHVKILNPFPVRGKDYYKFIVKSFWSETYVEGGVSDAKMDRILQLYDYMYSDEGILINMFGFEGEDYELTDSGVNLLKTDDEGTPLTAYDLYPIMQGGFSYLAAWNGDLVQYVNPAIPQDIREITTEVRDYRLKNWKTPPVDWAVQAINVPEKQQMSISLAADWTNFIVDDSGKSEEQMYQDMLKNWDAGGYNATSAAITAAAKAMGK